MAVSLLADQFVERRFGSEGTVGAMGIVVGSVVDGVPESMILGIQVGVGNPVSLGFVAAVFISNSLKGLSSVTLKPGLRPPDAKLWVPKEPGA